jgi:L-fuconolactonase
MRDFLPEHLAPLLEGSLMDGCIAVQAASTIFETRWLLSLAAAHPFILGVVGWADLTKADMARDLDDLPQRKKLRGLRHIVEDEQDLEWLLRDDVARSLEECRRLGLCYDILVREPQWPAALRCARAHPELRLVLDHCGKPPIRAGNLDAWRQFMKDMAALDHVSCKLSGLVTEADWRNWSEADLRPIVDMALDTFGTERLMLGSDWPVCTVAAPYGRTFHALEPAFDQLSCDERARIRGGTAAAIYGI